MHRFKSALDNLELKEIHLHGRKYIWSSETDSPTLTKIDHVFCTKEGNEPPAQLYAGPVFLSF
jgi:hypothetical protein